MPDRETWDVVVLGAVNSDYLARGQRLPAAGATTRGDEFYEGPGGKAANQAVAAARLGARAALIARVGDDSRGRDLLQRLAVEGVDTRFVARDANADTGVALIQVDRSGEKQIMWSPGANERLSTADIRAAAAVFTSTRVLLAPLEAPLDCVWEAIRLARGAGARVVLDPAPPRQLPDDLLRSIDVIRPNASEAEALTGIRVTDPGSAKRAAQTLLDRGAGAVMVQAGEEGNLLLTRDGERLFPRLPVQSVDATGAGDALAATLAALLAEGRPLPEAARLANAAAALATTALGAQTALPRREQIEALLASAAG